MMFRSRLSESQSLPFAFTYLLLVAQISPLQTKESRITKSASLLALLPVLLALLLALLLLLSLRRA